MHVQGQLSADSSSPAAPGAEGTQRLAEGLGPYRLVQQIGEGGMGVVHLALDPHGRAVAIKVLRPNVAHDEDARARLEREVTSLARVRHPRVAPVIDADLYGERPYVVTRYIAGDPLDDAVAARGPLSGASLLRVARGLVGALEAIHEVGVVHRDLKPANVLLDDEGEPVVIDFGIAHLADDSRLTATGMVMGTPGYLAPEIIEGAEVTPATDWWGWAATLVFAATGRPPFGRGSMDLVLTRVRAGHSDLTGIDARLEPLLSAALAPRPQDRPPIATVLAGLERYAAGGDSADLLPAGHVPHRATLVMPQVAPTAEHAAPLSSGYAVPPPQGYAAPRPPAPYPAPASGAPRYAAPPPQGYAVPPGYAAPVPPAAVAVAPVPPAGQAGPLARLGPLGEVDEPDEEPFDDAPGAGDPRIGRPDRTGTLSVVALLIAAGAAVAPVIALLVALGWSWLARTVDKSVTSLVLRRFEHGRRRSDVPVAVALGPVHVIGAAVAAVFALLLPVLVGLAAVFCVALVGSAVGHTPADPTQPLGLAVGAAVGTLIAWWGPGGASLRRGSKSAVRGLLPVGLVTDVVVALLLAAAVGLGIWAAMHGGHALWWPLSGPPGVLSSWP